MHEDILTINQKNLAESVLPRFASSFTLCGGTAIALQLGHRGSIDFDLLSFIEINAHGIIRRLNSVNAVIEHTIVSSIDELTVVVNSVKLTFFTFPFRIPAVVTWPMASIAMPTLLDLASMKAYALGRRGKWKDYVDLYFLFQGHVSMPQLVENCRNVDMTEQVSYLEKGPSDRNIQNFLTNLATSS